MTAQSADQVPDAGLSDAAEAASALDMLLSDAALGIARRFRPDAAAPSNNPLISPVAWKAGALVLPGRAGSGG
jgi:hypothetical protein